MTDRHYYMVRAMFSRDEDFRAFFTNHVVAVGWSKVDFTAFSDSAELQDAVYNVYYAKKDKAQQVISKKLNEIRRFKEIQKGDYILVPFNSHVVLAEAEAKESYAEEYCEQDLANQRSVTYRYKNGSPLFIPRSELSEGLQRRLRVRGNTVSDLVEFKEEIEKIFTWESYSYSQEMREIEQQEWQKLKAGLLENIQRGRTKLQTGGIGLEKLVCELMQCEGYEARVLAKNKFTGKADADICATKKDSFLSKKIFIQVKHHSGYSGKQGIQQIAEVLMQKEYEGYEGYFVTSALVSEDVRAFAAEYGIQVMDGHALVEFIINNLDRLSGTTKRLLGICDIPQIVF